MVSMNPIVKSLKFYTSMTETTPGNLNKLVEAGYLLKKETLDPWGRPFVLETKDPYFVIFSHGASLDDPNDNIYFNDELK